MADNTTQVDASENQNQSTEDQLAPLKAQIESERKRRELAEKRAEEVTKVATERTALVHTATDQQLSAAEEAVASGLASAEAEIQRAKQAYALALEAQDYGAASEANASLSAATARKFDMEMRKSQVEQWKADWAQKKETLTVPKAPADELAAFTPRSRAWIEKNIDKWGDKRFQRRVELAHYDAEEANIAPDTDEYFAFIEDKVGLRKKEAPKVETAPKQSDDGSVEIDLNAPDDTSTVDRGVETPPLEKKTVKAGTAAPSSRSLPAGSGGKPAPIRLTPGEMDAAKYSFPEEYKENPQKAYTLYARNKQALMASRPEVFN